ncbi:RNA recognition motif-containing protein [Blastocystis sp. ATCC 50177/Nand II]|uniref:RNA recognition motif-containing protein n=1 Tax=Blastocystis sp. subtype 1 (strain ATCC 50177 / NandII) TaxID=478820 RepID=A0A196SM07_BLAHN|nr:RNA recognition motif-containing protein [Blastocystis sp. ATCC 50177/Nand II]
MSRTLWIGDVQENWTEDYLCALMRNAKGLVSIKLMRDRATGEPQGFGFIDFATEEDAINGLNGYNGRPIPGTGYTFRLNYGGNGKNSNYSDNYSIYIGELEPNVTDSQLYQIFKEKYLSFCGAKIMRETGTNISKGFGFIQFRARDEAETALKQMNGYVINGKPIKLSYASARRWQNEDSKGPTPLDVKYNVLVEGPEIPNIRPPPPTPAMIAKTIANNSSGGSSIMDAYGNEYDNPMFTNDPVFQAAVKARREKKMRLMGARSVMEVNDTEVPTDRSKGMNIQEENREFMRRMDPIFDLPSLVAPKLKV